MAAAATGAVVRRRGEENDDEEDILDVVRKRRQIFGAIVERHPQILQVPLSRLRVRLRNRQRPRLNWDEHVMRLTAVEFQRLYRLTLDSFNFVLAAIRPALEREADMARRSSPGGHVAPELQLSMALRFFAGGSYLDIQLMHGVHSTTAFAAMWRVVDALVASPVGKPRFPIDDVAALRSLAEGFSSRYNNPLANCVGAVDGIAIEIRRPGSDECSISRSFYNRKGFFAYNMQAVCDAQYRFRYASIACPGSTHDSLAFAVSTLGMKLERGELPSPFWIAGDEAYDCTESVLTPWSGRDLPVDKDAFNFFLSSSRIHIEQSFGMLVARFGILRRAIETHYARVPKLIMALLRLHNVCVDARIGILRTDERDRRRDDQLRLRMNSNGLESRQGLRRDHDESTRRQRLTQEIALLGLKRPGRE